MGSENIAIAPRCEATLDAGPLRVCFFRRGDRYGHQIRLSSGEVLLESVEGRPDAVWPPSPALQELERHDVAGPAALLLVGMAGSAHWSLSAEVAADKTGLIFDVACRTPGPKPRLGSTYRFPPGVDWNGAAGKLVAPSRNHAILSIATEIGSLVESQNGLIEINPSRPGEVSSRTTRWRYVVSLSQEADLACYQP